MRCFAFVAAAAAFARQRFRPQITQRLCLRPVPMFRMAHARNVLDFWAAEGDGPRPVLVYIHGGGWTAGDKKQNDAAIRPYVDRGISCASINYRLSGTDPLPAQYATRRA